MIPLAAGERRPERGYGGGNGHHTGCPNGQPVRAHVVRVWRPPRTRAAGVAPLAELLASLTASLPRFDRPACKGRHELFDASTASDAAEAQRICRSCPALGQCRDWLSSLPSRRRPIGVVAAQWRAGRR
jgi:WhiB family transcriptional regulator, redox-sensing transcriptional regulator